MVIFKALKHLYPQITNALKQYSRLPIGHLLMPFPLSFSTTNFLRYWYDILASTFESCTHIVYVTESRWSNLYIWMRVLLPLHCIWLYHFVHLHIASSLARSFHQQALSPNFAAMSPHDLWWKWLDNNQAFTDQPLLIDVLTFIFRQVNFHEPCVRCTVKKFVSGSKYTS